jgi:hypothetical protein
VSSRAAVTLDFCESESESESSVGPESQNKKNDSQILRVKSRVKPITLKFFESRVESIQMTPKFWESTQESTQELTRKIFLIIFF